MQFSPHQPVGNQASSDATDPLTPKGGYEERVEALWINDTARMERVEVWGEGQRSDAFLRLSFSTETSLTTTLRQLLLQLPERETGFRDLLMLDGSAFAASFVPPDVCLSDLAPGKPGVAGLLRLRCLLDGLRRLSELFALIHQSSGLAWALPQAGQIGLRRVQPFRPHGYQGWQFQFTGWDALEMNGETSAAALAGLLLPALDLLSDQAAGSASPFCLRELQRVRSMLDQLSQDSTLSLSQLGLLLQSWLQVELSIHGQTDVGVRRQHNEDAYLVLHQEQQSAFGANFCLAAVADGMGGHSSGEVASSLALDLMRMQLLQLSLAPRSRAVDSAGLAEDINAAVQGTERALRERAAMDPVLAGMGTTLVGFAQLAPQSTMDSSLPPSHYIFNVGDSRAYLLSAQGISRLSLDHSHVQELLDSGQISEDDAFSHPQKNVITRCLGGGGDSDPAADTFAFTPGPGEIILLCSDGLSDALRDSEISAVAAQLNWQDGGASTASFLELLAQSLIDAANAAGGPDNITVVLLACSSR
jgi:protein phosphatase